MNILKWLKRIINIFIPNLIFSIGKLLAQYFNISLMDLVMFVCFLGLWAFLLDCFNAWPSHRTDTFLRLWHKIFYLMQ